MKTWLNKKEFIRFIIVGIINTLFGYSIFLTLVFVGLHHTLAIILATIIGVIFNFKTIGSLVFNKNNYRLIPLFVMTYTIVCFLNILILKLLSFWIVTVYISGGIAISISALVSYYLNKNYVFKEPSHENN